MRRIRLSYANVMSTIAVFLALGGGAYAAVSSITGAGGMIHGCYAKKNGSLRLIAAGKKCAKGEKAIAFNQQGRQGLPGTPGAAGAAGAAGVKGEQGPQGPGATSVSTTIAHESAATIATLSNGLILEGICGSSGVALLLKTPTAAKTVTGWGTVTIEKVLYSEENSGAASLGAESGTQVDVDLTARGSSTSAFERVHAHGTPGSPCTFTAMITPSS
jgi:hypothetical protein